MKKTIKTAMFSLAVLAAGFGGVKAYNAYTFNNTLMAENIEALSNGGDAGTKPCPNGYSSYKNEAPWPWSDKQTFGYCGSGGCDDKTGYSPEGSCL